MCAITKCSTCPNKVKKCQLINGQCVNCYAKKAQEEHKKLKGDTLQNPNE